MRYIALIMLAILLSGCSGRRQALANAGASIWEAAECLQQGGPIDPCVKILKIQSKAIIISQGATYRPAGVIEGKPTK